MNIVLLAAGTVRSSLTARLVNLGRELVRLGHNVSLIAPSCDKYSQFQTETFTELEGIKIIRPFQFKTKNTHLNMLAYIPAALLYLWREKADVVHLYKPTPVTIIGLLTKAKVVLDMDDLGSQVMQRIGAPAWAVKLTAWCEDTAARRAHGIIVVSTFLQNFYRQHLPDQQVRVIPNGAQRIYAPSPAKDRQIVFIGSMDSRQILEPLVLALPNVRLGATKVRLIGDGTERAYFENLVKKQGLTKNVEFLGWVAHDDIPKLVHDGDIGYCCVPNEPTYKAASSQKIFDYLSMGVLPLVNKVGDLPTYINDGEVGYIVETDIATAINQALQDTAFIRRSTAARKRVQTLYLWPKLAQQALAFYKELTA